MKKIAVLLAMLFCVTLLAACQTQPATPEEGTQENPLMSAVWTGYDKMPFPEFLGTAMENMPAELGVVESYEVTATTGWPEGMNDIPLEPAEGTVPVTYTFVLEVSEGGSDVEKGIIEFAVGLNEDTNTFEIECIFLNGEYMPQESIEPGMKPLCLLADGEAHKIYEMEIVSETVIKE